MTKVLFIFLLLWAAQCCGQKFPDYDPFWYNGGGENGGGVDYSWWTLPFGWGWFSSSPDTATTIKSTTKSTTPTTTPKTTAYVKPPPPKVEIVDGLFERNENGDLVLEGDMVIPEKHRNFYLTIYGIKKPIVVEKRSISDDVTDDVIDEEGHREKRSVLHLKNSYWKIGPGPNYNIPYYVNKNVASSTRRNMGEAITEFNKYTCVRFKETRSPTGDYLNITDGDGCWAWKGRIGGGQNVTLQNYACGVSTIIHELMHALGFHHEQARPDRDKYVTILHDNILDNEYHNFKKQVNSLTHDTPYDFRSVMHYQLNAFSKDYNKLNTIQLDTPFDEPEMIGHYPALSYYDLQQLKKVYPCGKVFLPTYLQSTKSPPCEDKYDWCRYNYMVCVKSSSSCKKTCGRCQ